MLRERRRLAHYKLSSRLDRKSSRGMIYENEELRLRTININAEVERGQSDIKRLRRENEQLRREIWTLRDECDRLNKRFKAKLLDRHSGCSGGGRPSSHVCDSNCNSDDSDSCDTCKGNDDQCSDECCTGGSCPQLATKPPFIEFAPDTPTSPAPRTDTAKLGVNSMRAESESTPNLHQAFDHLSVVSEETMSNADLHPPVPHNEMLHIYTPDSGGSQMTLPSLVGPLTPLTPIEQVANQLNDLQAVVPPLSYFENILQDHMGSNIGNTPSASSPTSKNMRHTNGWDYKLQSPFAHRKISGDSSQPALQIATFSPNMGPQQRLAPPQLLTTFVPTIVPPAAGKESSSNSMGLTVTAPSVPNQPNTSAIETVAITTTPVNGPSTLNSPKHFFAPLKPRLKINTALANKTAKNTNVPGVPASNSIPITVAADVEGNACQNCEPPDLYVHNGLASPYQRQIATATSAANAVPPPVPQRGSSSQVSPQHRACAHFQHQYLQERQQQQPNIRQHLHPHQYSPQHRRQHRRPLQQQHSQPQSPPALQQSVVTITLTVDDADEFAAGAGAGAVAACGTDATVAAAAALNTLAVTGNRAASALINSPISLQASLYATATIPILQSPAALPAVLVAQPNTVITKLNEPIYATAQKRSKSLITAPALTKPLVAAIITPTKRPTPTTSNISSAAVTPVHSPIPAPTPTAVPKAKLVDGHSQTESVNLETILNDIQSISEDILAIQLDKRKGNDNDISKPLDQNDKNKKPYRSEMNLTLQYDNVSQATTTANKTATATQTSFSNNGHNNARCTRSLEREHTDSPSPHIPDAMVPFPDKRTYIGFDQLNNEAIIELPPSSVANMQRPPLPPVVTTPNKAQPATPSARGFPSPLNIRCAGVARGTPVSIPEPPGQEAAVSAQVSSSVIAGLSPNKSQLYTAIANAAAKRAQYRTAMVHSLEGDMTAAAAAAGADGNNVDAASEALSSEAARRKARRVSIVCGDSSTPDSPDPVTNPHLIRSQAQINLSGMEDAGTSNAATTNSNSTTTTTVTTTTMNTINPSAGSCSDLPSALVNPALRNLKQTSHSTPNSPHSVRRRSNSNTMSPHNSICDTAHPPQSLSANTSPRHTATVHHHHSNSSCSNISVAQQRKSSQDSTRGNPTELAAVEANAGRSRCSRRHSDGTVASNAHRVSGTSGHHHHHHHHHHQHSSSVLSNNLHHSHHSHQDSSSLSEHGSNSSASSRESSTSFSVRSHRRKISISSHTGGKIPWCGCWGNGCL